jgi:hypothetical protein
MLCPGSVGLSQGIPHEVESDFASLGTAAHTLAADCLRDGSDAWEYVGWGMDPDLTIDQDMADAVQAYLNAARELHGDSHDGHMLHRNVNAWIEHRFHCPTIHEAFYGTVDLAWRDGRTLHVWDYKHGVGVVVEVENNVQCMYYAAGLLESKGLWRTVDNVVLHIAQPRGFHRDGPIRSWSIDTNALDCWVDDMLIPAMNRAQASNDTASGSHCQFCPVRKRACPQLLQDSDELEALMKQVVAELTNDQVARYMDLVATVKIAGTAAVQTAFARLNSGQVIPGYKLVAGRANRTWKDGAEPAIKADFGPDAYTLPELKSPAQIEKLPKGEAACARWAFKPDAGLTVAKIADGRSEVSRDKKSMFKPVGK